MDFFKGEDFPMSMETDGHVTVDVSFELAQWRRIWGKKSALPWNKKSGRVSVPVSGDARE